MRKSLSLLGAVAILSATGCSGMSNTQQRVLSGAAIGTAAGVGVGALSGGGLVWGAVGGAAVGALGGYAYDQYEKSKAKPNKNQNP